VALDYHSIKAVARDNNKHSGSGLFISPPWSFFHVECAPAGFYDLVFIGAGREVISQKCDICGGLLGLFPVKENSAHE